MFRRVGVWGDLVVIRILGSNTQNKIKHKQQTNTWLRRKRNLYICVPHQTRFVCDTPIQEALNEPVEENAS